MGSYFSKYMFPSQIINQVNDEFIAAWMMYGEVKILLMIDQHAVHERIRYENLLLSKQF